MSPKCKWFISKLQTYITVIWNEREKIRDLYRCGKKASLGNYLSSTRSGKWFQWILNVFITDLISLFQRELISVCRWHQIDRKSGSKSTLKFPTLTNRVKLVKSSRKSRILCNHIVFEFSTAPSLPSGRMKIVRENSRRPRVRYFRSELKIICLPVFIFAYFICQINRRAYFS